MFTSSKPRPRTAPRTRGAVAIGLAALLSPLLACHDDEPAQQGKAQKSSGGESVFDEAGRSIDQAHRDFQEEVRPVAKEVDRSANEAVREGKTAVDKTADAVTKDD